MKKIFFLLLTLFSGLNLSAQTLSGKVTDAATQKPISGVIINLPQVKLSAITDSSGSYKIPQVPKGTYSVETQLLGYATSIKQVTIIGQATLNFSLTVSTSTMQEVVITGLGNETTNKRAPTPVELVTHQAYIEAPSTNVVDAIALQPGVTAITTGPGVSKPEIRGLGFNRVITTLDGVPQEDFQWGDEHGIQIDPYAIYDVEILRGPATLEYGSDAMGGVVNFKTEPFPANNTVQGSVLSEFQTNDGLIGNSADVSGNHNGFVWDLRISSEEAHCYSDPKDGYVWGTAFNENNARFSMGINKKWGYSRLIFTALHRTLEIPDGNRDSATGQFMFDFPINGQNLPNRSNFFSYDPTFVGYQQIEHDEVAWQNSINVGRGNIIANVAYTQNHREEIDTGTIPLLDMYMHDIPYSVKYQIQTDSGLKFSVGANGMYEEMNNASEAGYPYVSVFLVPNYQLFDVGGFAVLQKDFKNLTLSAGVRFDNRSETGQSLYLLNAGYPEQAPVPAGTPGAYQNFPGFTADYSGFSGSLGATYLINETDYVKLNVSKGYRAPSITEIGENGVHPGTSEYEIGDPTLKPESSYEGDVAFGSTGRDVSFEFDGFINDIQNFIFASRLGSKLGGDSVSGGPYPLSEQGFPVFKFQASTAYIAGVEAFFNVHPKDTRWIELDNGFTYIYSYLLNQTDSTQHVPWTPAPRLTSEVKFNIPTGHSFLGSTYIEVGAAHYWAQPNIYSAYLTELPSEAYTLLNAGVGTNFVSRKTRRIICSLFINCTNLTNLAYYDHTSRPLYFLAYNGVTPVTVTNPTQGIWNMGRNIGFKLVVPFGNGVANSNISAGSEY